MGTEPKNIQKKPLKRPEKENMLATEVFHILDVIEKQHLIERTYTASDHNTVAAIIHDAWEIKCLLEDKDTNFPLMLARYQEEKANMTDETRLMYFVMFRLYRDEAAISELVSYLVSCRTVVPREKVKFFSPWHPFFHAAQALAILSHHQIRVPTGSEVLNDLDTFVKDVVQWSICQDNEVNNPIA
ncbi:MAG TPA: hypothetical protein VN207_11245 [Ktedonobacteraceae bacterium]|nr:hypothetical protein [Ktedonobacteraceae bacterium]